MYHSWPVYSPYVPHDWELRKKEPKRHTFSDYDEFEQNPTQLNSAPEEDGLDFVSGLRRMSFEGLKDRDRVTKEQKAAMPHQPCKCVHGMEECCAYETHEKQALLEYFQAPAAVPQFHKAHYCISGDEPECDHLRREEELRR